MSKQKTEQAEKKPSVNFQYKLYNLFGAIKHLGRINIKATQQGLEIWGMDYSNTMMTIIKIDRDNFREYNLSKELEIATDTDYFKIVKRLLMVKAYLDSEKMIFEEDKTKIEMPVFDSDEMKEKPKLDLKKAVSFDLSSYEVRKTLKDIEAIQSDSFYIEFKGKLAIFSATGRYGKLTKTLEPYERGIKKYEKSKDSIKVCLSTELFKNALNGIRSKMRITIGENAPLIVEEISEEEDQYAIKSDYKITHYIAPRYTEEDF